MHCATWHPTAARLATARSRDAIIRRCAGRHGRRRLSGSGCRASHAARLGAQRSAGATPPGRPSKPRSAPSQRSAPRVSSTAAAAAEQHPPSASFYAPPPRVPPPPFARSNAARPAVTFGRGFHRGVAAAAAPGAAAAAAVFIFSSGGAPAPPRASSMPGDFVLRASEREGEHRLGAPRTAGPQHRSSSSSSPRPAGSRSIWRVDDASFSAFCVWVLIERSHGIEDGISNWVCGPRHERPQRVRSLRARCITTALLSTRRAAPAQRHVLLLAGKCKLAPSRLPRRSPFVGRAAPR